MTHPVVVLDFETTGLSPDRGDRATEIAAVVLDSGRIVDRYQSLMNAGLRIPWFIERLTGISDAMVRGAPPATQVMREFATFLRDFPVVAHNVSFDRKFLVAEMGRIGVEVRQEFLCSMRVARRIFPEAENHKLETLQDYARLPGTGRHHRALADAELAAHLWQRMTDELRRRYALRSVPLALMRDVQNLPCRGLDDAIERLRRRHGA